MNYCGAPWTAAQFSHKVSRCSLLLPDLARRHCEGFPVGEEALRLDPGEVGGIRSQCSDS